MAVNSEVKKKTYTLNSSVTTFPITFDITYDVDGNAEDIACMRTEVDGNGNIVGYPLVIGVDFSVSGANVIYADAVNNSGDSLIIYRSIPLTQILDYINNGNYGLEDIEKALDKLTLIAQQIQEQGDRNIKLSIAESGDMVLPAQSVRASKMLGFDASGDPMAGEGITAVVTDFIKTLCDDVDDETARTTLDVYSKAGVEAYADEVGEEALQNLEVRTDDPSDPGVGRIWFRSDI